MYTIAKFPIEKNNPLGILVFGLLDCLCAFSVQDMKTNIVASYLIIE